MVDDRAVAAARADENLQNTLRLRTRYIDDTVVTFATRHASDGPQVLLLGAGYDARAYRLDVPAVYFEVDFPATLDDKAGLLAAHAPVRSRKAVPVDLAAAGFVRPLVDAGFSTERPTIVVWEGVSMYVDPDTAEGVIAQIGAATTARGALVADYAEMSWFKGTDLERNTAALADDLNRGGERLEAGVRDMHGTLAANGFDVVDDIPVEDLRPRFGLDPRPPVYPARMITAIKRAP